MSCAGETMESIAPGANGRVGIHLVARAADSSRVDTLGYAYHTTNVVPNTYTGLTSQPYPATRLLWKECARLPGLAGAAAVGVDADVGR
eukprot:10806827-Alexandrium_andersonii.AAC.1